MKNQIKSLNDSPELNELKNIRRHLHTYPELGFTEFWTTAQICKYLDNWGVEFIFGKKLYQEIDQVEFKKNLGIVLSCLDENYEQAAKVEESPWLLDQKGGFTGAIAHIKGSQPGPKFGFRFDIDALPINESKDSDHIPAKEAFFSKNSNMHTCGHDGHMAIGLGLAKKLIENQDKFRGDCYLIFQPAEELGKGAKIFKQFQIVKNLDYIVSLHLGLIPDRNLVTNLKFLAGKWFKVNFVGKEAHATNAPNLGKNALLAACCSVNNLYSISRHSSGTSRIEIGRFRSDNPPNIVAPDVEFHLGLRGENQEVCDYLQEQAASIVRGAAQMYGVHALFELEGEIITADNSPDLAQKVKKAAIKANVEKNCIEDYHLALGSEDAFFLIDTVKKNGGKGTYIGLGSPTKGGHHNPCFDFDEDLLLWGVKILWELTKDL